MNRRKNWTWVFLLVLLLVILAGVTLANLRYIRANSHRSDFAVYWLTTRNFLIDGDDPYGQENQREVERLVYGRNARTGEPEPAFNYPLYSVIVFLPFALIPDMEVARALWMTLLEVCLFMMVVFSVQLARWRPSIITLGAFFLFAFTWFHSASPLLTGDMVIVVAFLIIAGFVALQSGADELAGILFAFATIKPNVVVLLILFLLVWGIAQRRWRMVSWLLGMVFLLGAGMALLMPDWIVEFIRALVRFVINDQVVTLRSALIGWLPGTGARIGLGVTGLMIIIMLTEWILFRNAEFRGLYWASCLTLAASQWVGVPTGPENMIVLFPALTLIWGVWEERWRIGRGLTWVGMLAFLVGLWWLFLRNLSPLTLYSLPLALFIPLPLFTLIGLYWIRWWAIQPPSLLFEWVYEQEHFRR